MATHLESLQTGHGRAYLPASTLIEWLAANASSSVFVYDLAAHAGFGNLTMEWSEHKDVPATASSLQTRSGAGLGLVGRLSDQGTSKAALRESVLTAYNTPSGLSAMARSFSYLPLPSPRSRLILQVPMVTTVGPTLAISPTLAPLASIWQTLPASFSVFLSATPQESIKLATLAYKITSSHVIHLFDHHSSAREFGHIDSQPVPSLSDGYSSVGDVFKEAGVRYFDYVGGNDATVVVIMLNGPLALAAKSLATRAPSLGVLIVRVLRPWDEASMRASLPSTVKHVHVLDDVPSDATLGTLYIDVLGTLAGIGKPTTIVQAHRVIPVRTQNFIDTPSSFTTFLLGLLPSPPTRPPCVTDGSANLKRLLFFGNPSSTLSSLPQSISNSFITNRAIRARLLVDNDLFSKPGGVTLTRLLLSAKSDIDEHVPMPILLPLGSASNGHEQYTSDFVAVLDHTLLKTHSVVSQLRPESPLLIFTSWSAADVAGNLPTITLSLLRERCIRVYRLDTKAVTKELSSSGGDQLQIALGHLAFLRLYLGRAATESLLQKLARGIYGAVIDGVAIEKVNSIAWAALEEIELPEKGVLEVGRLEPELKNFQFNAVSIDSNEGKKATAAAQLGSWHVAANHILFPDVFSPRPEITADKSPQNPALRPDITDRTFLVTCTVNRRLTPLEYDRNVFHLEFDTTGTGLKYAIGEALGVHGWNDTNDVLDFCRWYGTDPENLIRIPLPVGDGNLHNRTVLQALQQQIDLFGKPPKSFYYELAQYATRKEDRLALLFIGSPEGSSTFKKQSEKDTVTFADVLQKYQSARPSIEVLCELIGDIKPRHYSIASAQSAVGDRVDLLVVTVDWVTPSGSPRYGQCTRYLVGLKIGQKVTVSIKPSVMKLPPDNMQPIILAGLGTGAAPFRAFWQHRAWLTSQGIPVGPLYYYFGSRHRLQEYLYGEEVEAHILDKIISHAGLAFSRDGKTKVYIQHKMQEDAEALARMLHDQNGVFYLCGPTWPVPDVYEALVGALIKHVGMKPIDAADYLEGLKEEERYVLEVY